MEKIVKVKFLDTEKERFKIISDLLKSSKDILNHQEEIVVLDVGAGQKIYQQICLDLHYQYFSHDFNKYEGKKNSEFENDAFQHDRWNNIVKYDFVSDILELPSNFADIIICTEVFEHVPDPIRAFESIYRAGKKNAVLIISVPTQSWIHQAPYYFFSGISFFWFEHMSKKLNLNIIKYYILGDSLNYLIHHGFLGFGYYLNLFSRIFLNTTSNLIRKMYKNKNVLDSASNDSIYFLSKKDI